MADNNVEKINKSENDSIRIADEVIKHIAALAVRDVDGVSGVAGAGLKEINSGAKLSDKAVKLHMNEDFISLVLSINVFYGYSIPKVCRNVQEKVSATIENMTGYTVSSVSVNVAGIVAEEKSAQ